jgi:hypothetical protein
MDMEGGELERVVNEYEVGDMRANRKQEDTNLAISYRQGYKPD